MIVWEVEAVLGVAFFAILVPALAFPFVGHLYRRFGRLEPIPLLVGIGGALYVCGLVAFTLFPIPEDSAAACAYPAAGWRLEPLASWREVVDVGRAIGPTRLVTSSVFLQEVMNIALFVPLGFLIGYRSRLRWWTVGAIALGVSVLIELTQGTAVWGLYDCPYRLAEFDDLLTNTAGAILGLGLGRIATSRVPWPSPTAADRQSSPTLGRRAAAALLDVIALAMASVLLQLAVLGILWVAGATLSGDDPAPVLTALLAAPVPALLLFVAVPLLRPDRSTLGQATVLTMPVTESGAPPTPRAVAVRGIVRWTPLCVAVAVPAAGIRGLALAIVATQVLVVLLRRDHRSVAGLASRTTTALRRTPSNTVEQRRSDRTSTTTRGVGPTAAEGHSPAP